MYRLYGWPALVLASLLLNLVQIPVALGRVQTHDLYIASTTLYTNCASLAGRNYAILCFLAQFLIHSTHDTVHYKNI